MVNLFDGGYPMPDEIDFDFLDDWICAVCGETFVDDGSGHCPYCGSEDYQEIEEVE